MTQFFAILQIVAIKSHHVTDGLRVQDHLSQGRPQVGTSSVFKLTLNMWHYVTEKTMMSVVINKMFPTAVPSFNKLTIWLQKLLTCCTKKPNDLLAVHCSTNERNQRRYFAMCIFNTHSVAVCRFKELLSIKGAFSYRLGDTQNLASSEFFSSF